MNGPIVFGRMWRKAMRMCSSVLSIREMQYVEAARARYQPPPERYVRRKVYVKT
jgi:ABC-type dipeptide/oligopeptide/nickel transport system permease subunit